ncbi:(2E,6E)-farnesyl diphosphate synthase [Candidatus Thiosymbion oneisti]|uniref:(2E,6E)-farnesyl diphosphate synthase n=1 Tax=Candidatus Thiosymbion oneisti TaxID=589554 RepID=UPI000AA7A15A|nr:farnesyl diphosphate synthase [Candidatus Thiosymbion oneisti]
MSDPRLQAFLAACRERVTSALEAQLPAPEIQPEPLHRAMRYAVLGTGKYIRPALTYGAGLAIGLAPETLNAPACALELTHAYSLIHDDLPAMDDDDLRRGRPTCHKVFGEAMAILAGDALQTLAFQILASDDTVPGGAQARTAMVDTLARAAGSRGMAGGQALELNAFTSGRELDLVALENIHIHKTGALIRASVRMATLARPELDPKSTDHLDRYAKCLGLAFQIHDDILDVEGETAVIGKTRGKDQAQGKATYPALLGLAEARAQARMLVTEALTNLQDFDERADPLRWIARYIVDRDR